MTEPMFADPAIVAGEPGPAWEVIQGREVAIVVHRAGESGSFDDKSKLVPTVWFDLYVLDGAPFVYGVAPKATPPRLTPTHQVGVPCRFENQMSSHVSIVRALAPLAGKPMWLLGIVGKSEVGNKPYQINMIEETDPRKEQIRARVRAIVNGTLALQPAIELAPAAVIPQAAPVAPALPPYLQPATTIPQGVYVPQPAVPVPVPAPVPVVADVPVAGYEAIWPTLSPQQKDMVRAQAAAVAPAQPGNPF